MTMSHSSACPGCGLELQGMETHCPRCGLELSIVPPAPPPPIPGDAPNPMTMAGHCSNCGLQLPRFQPICPNCGARVSPVQSEPWNSAMGRIPPAAPEQKLITGNKIVDGILGFLFVPLTLMLGGIGILAIPITFLALNRKHRAFTQGMGIGVALTILLALGALVACLTSLKNL
ncbi:hypothetical protein CCAX7_006960 [Capsulimonas corticalis]|uniref:Uncharacterized protein n=1 Tax=Capsulimonas corticalis TaxID=2219043 RepID=A0A402D1I3_9BACT|nr:hypothetical protein [Capsulimonas corticalis]BDI28645.1 hypothetical protein CCAX7_006960 [Capsulimonas corticalis]